MATPMDGAAEHEPSSGGRKTEQHTHSQKHRSHRRAPEGGNDEVAGSSDPVATRSINDSHMRSGPNDGTSNGNQHHHTGRNSGGYSNGSVKAVKGPAAVGPGDSVAAHQPDEPWYSIRRLLIDWSWPQCLGFEPKEHLYYQIGHALFLVAFLAPNIPCGFLLLRCAAIAGCILMLLWGWFVNCSLDAVVWFGGFLVVNTIYVVILLCKIRPVKFDREIESVYVALFKPLRVSRHQFKKVLNCMKIVRSLKFQEIYVQEKITKVDSLSLVLSGKLVISQNQKAHHIVFPHQFLDSPEWFGVSTDDFFQVSIMAIEESRVLIWHRDKLKLSMIAEPFLQAVFDHILGRDVVKKLMQVCEIMAQSNGCVPSGYGDDAEDKPMLAMKGKGADNGGHGLTALINRQLQDASIPLLPMGLTKEILDAPSSRTSSQASLEMVELYTGLATGNAQRHRSMLRRPIYPARLQSDSSLSSGASDLYFSMPPERFSASSSLMRPESTNTEPVRRSISLTSAEESAFNRAGSARRFNASSHVQTSTPNPSKEQHNLSVE